MSEAWKWILTSARSSKWSNNCMHYSNVQSIAFVCSTACRKLPRYVPYKCTYAPYNGTFGESDQGQMLDMWGWHPAVVNAELVVTPDITTSLRKIPWTSQDISVGISADLLDHTGWIQGWIQFNSHRMVCGFFLSWWGGPPQSFERSIWDCLGFYTIHTFLDPSVESQFRIISKSYNFLFGTTTTQPFTFSTSHFFSGQGWHASSSSIVLYLWLGARRPTAQLYHSGMVSRYYLGWPLCLHRGNSASKNLQQETQRPKCCLYKTPY